nr:MAG TPA: hypothetical protein [Caudoviricetes sp.]
MELEAEVIIVVVAVEEKELLKKHILLRQVPLYL